MKKVLCLLLSLMMIISLSGCSQNHHEFLNHQNYLEYADHKGNKLIINSKKIDFEEFNSVSCFDSDFQEVKDFTYEAKGDSLIITSENAEKITGIEIKSSYDKYMFRYLDSNIYAFLHYTWGDDIGYNLSGGNEYQFYTPKEMFEREKTEYEAIKTESETFEFFKGEWIREGDLTTFLIVGTNECGQKFVSYSRNAELNEMYYGSISYRYSQLRFSSDNGWGYFIDFTYDEETDTLRDGNIVLVRSN